MGCSGSSTSAAQREHEGMSINAERTQPALLWGQVLEGDFQSTLPFPLGGGGGHEDLHPQAPWSVPVLTQLHQSNK